MPRLFCFGLGYSAGRLADQLLAEGWSVAGTAREPGRIAALRARGIGVFVFDRTHSLPEGALSGATHLLSSVPPDGDGDPVLDGALSAILAEAPHLRWVGYLSTTGVYGDRGGAWVDETTPANPTSERGRRRVAAEARWLSLHRDHGLPVHVFRLAGIYGPGRSVLDDIRAGTARRIVKPGHLFGRIHVADIARVLRASMDRPNPGAIYNVADDEPAAQAEVVAFACGLLGVAAPPPQSLEAAALSPMALSFWRDNRRVRNGRIKKELGVVLGCPTYREGLRAILAEGG